MRVPAFFFLFIVICSCSGDYSPKPSGYFRIEPEQPVYRQFRDSLALFSFNVQQQASVSAVADTVDGDWYNIDYPSFDARIYCTLLPIRSGKDLIAASEDSRKFVYKHVPKADGISEKSYSDPENGVYALIYDVNGNVASPVQFVITDSVHYFFRGALYFNLVPNQDSIAPVKDYIRNDIQEIITSFRWLHE
ncbi:MAG: gliding motility protein GldD [Dysgonamonadaceae bacterium]|jgi:gliding motility-associated lipoprotein GldD|nr:gliding motility protein GldD [Dysgonamonadaceae bacterium]